MKVVLVRMLLECWVSALRKWDRKEHLFDSRTLSQEFAEYVHMLESVTLEVIAIQSQLIFKALVSFIYSNWSITSSGEVWVGI